MTSLKEFIDAYCDLSMGDQFAISGILDQLSNNTSEKERETAIKCIEQFVTEPRLESRLVTLKVSFGVPAVPKGISDEDEYLEKVAEMFETTVRGFVKTLAKAYNVGYEVRT